MSRPNMRSVPDVAYAAIDVGQHAEFTETVTREMVDRFSELTGDYHPLHWDEAYAHASGFEGVLVHGFLATSFASRLIGMHLPGRRALAVSQQFHYTHPLYPGDSVTVRGEVAKKIDALSILVIDVTIQNQKGKQVSRGSLKVKVRAE